jgi:Flp pilus assembly protein TadB
MEELADSLRRLPGNGERIGAAIEVAMLSGGRSADVFLRLADRAATDADVARQRRTLTTQARLSALVVGGMPLLWLVFGGVGRMQSLVAAGATAVVVVGLAMELVGALLVWRLAAA